MPFNSFEELQATVKARREAILTLEVDLGGAYSQEHEDAKRELAQAKAMKALVGGQGFLGDNIEALDQRVAETKPETNSVWIQYKRLDLNEWAGLTKQVNLTAIDQYEKILPKTFVAVFGQDPTVLLGPDGEDLPVVEPLSRDSKLVSSLHPEDAILPGGLLQSVVQSFMAWQNSGGDVTIRPTRSGHVSP